jgi:hypothetical protein
MKPIPDLITWSKIEDGEKENRLDCSTPESADLMVR